MSADITFTKGNIGAHPMEHMIKQKLQEIEQTENIRILHAVESGSRAWGFPSPDSDYDVRFIYVRPLEDYLRLEKPRDVVEFPINDLLDINGWDLKKALQLLHSSNPTLFEWMASPIVYLQTDFQQEFEPVLERYFSPMKGIYHYISTAESNYRDYLRGDMVKAKKYFYVLRPLLAGKWILEKKSPPPMLFSALVESQLEPALKATVSQLLNLKMNAPEVKEIPRIAELNDYLDEGILQVKAAVKELPNEKPPAWDPLNQLFRNIVMR